jgi:hypothetical protein
MIFLPSPEPVHVESRLIFLSEYVLDYTDLLFSSVSEEEKLVLAQILDAWVQALHQVTQRQRGLEADIPQGDSQLILITKEGGEYCLLLEIYIGDSGRIYELIADYSFDDQSFPLLVSTLLNTEEAYDILGDLLPRYQEPLQQTLRYLEERFVDGNTQAPSSLSNTRVPSPPRWERPLR